MSSRKKEIRRLVAELDAGVAELEAGVAALIAALAEAEKEQVGGKGGPVESTRQGDR